MAAQYLWITHIIYITTCNWRLVQKVDDFKLDPSLFQSFWTILRPELGLSNFELPSYILKDKS